VELISEEMTHGIQKFLRHAASNWSCNLTRGTAIPLTIPKVVDDGTVDGILLRPPANRALLEQFCRNRKAVLLGNGFPDLDIPSVLMDDEGVSAA